MFADQGVDKAGHSCKGPGGLETTKQATGNQASLSHPKKHIQEWIQYLKGGMGDVKPHHADAADTWKNPDFSIFFFGFWLDLLGWNEWN